MIITIYTDGACSKNPGIGGWGAVIICNNEHHEIYGHDDFTTNNRMELMAAIEALKHISQSPTMKNASVQLYTDSQYVKMGITSWIQTWKQNNWRLSSSNKPIKNLDLWMALNDLHGQLNVSWHWVKGHSNTPGNVQADLLATTAVKKRQAMIKCGSTTK